MLRDECAEDSGVLLSSVYFCNSKVSKLSSVLLTTQLVDSLRDEFATEDSEVLLSKGETVDGTLKTRAEVLELLALLVQKYTYCFQKYKN